MIKKDKILHFSPNCEIKIIISTFKVIIVKYKIMIMRYKVIISTFKVINVR